MAQELKLPKIPEPLAMRVAGPAQARAASDATKGFAAALGFSPVECEEIALVVAELTSNLIKHVGEGDIQLRSIESAGRAGIEIVSEDNGTGIPDVERGITDGYSTAGSLGGGLGAVNRLMDGLEFFPRPQAGLRIVCQRWVRPATRNVSGRWLEFGAATRACRMLPENGDTFVIRQWEGHALAGVIDGLGHGPFAQRAAQAARHYIEHHFDQPLESLFRGVGRACHATRGVVMALARFDLAEAKVQVASVGNVELRLVGSPEPFRSIVRRGIVGLNGAPKPVPTDHPWTSACILIFHSDGVTARWNSDELAKVTGEGAGVMARWLLERYGRLEDDATVLVARSPRL
jgi:anti-sigma regulatory factor (Ser/Thr protein kinase)/serine/threonine protein phosphatase PrpC